MSGPDQAILRQACIELSARDKALARAYAEIDLPNWRHRPANYATLARIVVYQLISAKAADAIWARVQARYQTVTAEAVLEDDQEALRACGLSRPKLSHLNAIAEAVKSDDLNFTDLAKAPVDAARKRLLAVRGIGPWTAETFMMNALGQLDAFPHGDVGLMESYKRLMAAETRLSAKAFSVHAEGWRPFRAVAAHLLYDWLHLDRGR